VHCSDVSSRLLPSISITVFNLIISHSAYWNGEKSSLCCLVSLCASHGTWTRERKDEIREKIIGNHCQGNSYSTTSEQFHVPVTTAASKHTSFPPRIKVKLYPVALWVKVASVEGDPSLKPNWSSTSHPQNLSQLLPQSGKMNYFTEHGENVLLSRYK